MSDEIAMIPIKQIRILNPRPRDHKKFELIVQSIKNLGLKNPIQVSRRFKDEPEEEGYDLICGQGRIEAFIALGEKEIPAIVVEISKEDRLIRSLVENIARRYPAPMDLIREIERLREQGYTFEQIAKKLDAGETLVKGLVALKNSGEERLLEAAIKGKVPLWVAIEIAQTESIEMQRELLKGYESKQLNQFSIRTVKRLMEQRRLRGKRRGGSTLIPKSKTSVESMVNVYQRETERRKAMVKKARICDTRLTFFVGTFGKLLADENFVNLLRAESLATLPKYLSSKISHKHKEIT
jgi:ParB family transcriptional regulator, chromosome partitioning protein